MMSLRKILYISLFMWSGITCHAQVLSDSIPVDTILLDDGTLYTGQVVDSLFNGRGTCIYPDGTVYEGSWKDGMWDGQGTLRYPDGDIYTGHFKQHEKEGEGTYLYADGAKYEGEWSHDMFNGKGRLLFSDGGVYEGFWKDDKKHGFGQLTSYDRNKYSGYFYNDEYLGMPFDVEIDAEVPLTDELKEWGFKQEETYEIPQCSFALSYGSKGIATLSFWMDYSNNFFWGLSLGKNLDPPTQGQETGMAWSSLPGDVHMEGLFISSIYSVDLGIRFNRITVAGGVGAGINNIYRNCRTNGEPESYKEWELKYGEPYYKKSMIGATMVYRAILRYSIYIKNRPKVSTHLGYGNSEGLFLGFGITL